MTSRLFFIIFLGLSTGFLFEKHDLSHVSNKDRQTYLNQAIVWHETDIPKTDVLAGQKTPIAAAPEQEVTCQYIEPQTPTGGFAPKFQCKLKDTEETVRIKYGSHETYAEMAGTRLLWVLGYFTDANYPVRLKCLECPEKSPFHPSKDEARIERTMDDAIMEQDFPGEAIEHYNDQGWTWKELDQINETQGKAHAGEIDALKLLAVFMQHTDSKHQQQRLACYAEDIESHGTTTTCKRPVLMIQDLGQTFGKGQATIADTSSMNLQAWEGQEIWNKDKEAAYAQSHAGAQACFGSLISAQFAEKDGISNPQISEAGRSFLARLLDQLTDQQIADLFRAARADKTGEMVDTGNGPTPATIDDWVSAFKKKRQQIDDHHCGG